jgi:tetratricopeptide (TPR) repeat protein
MAHVLQGWLLACGRDPKRVAAVRDVVARATPLPANEREQAHLAALAAVRDDDYELAKVRLGALLRAWPLDPLAAHAAHSFDYVTGDTGRLRDRIAALLPAWTSALPGYPALLAMHAFGLEECGEHERAERTAHSALALDPLDARAHHVLAHVFEMTGRSDEGVRWMTAHREAWSTDSMAATHCWWHLALFHLAEGRIDRALALYDERLRAHGSTEVADLIDASALLWRVQLQGGDAGDRGCELADAWAPHIDDRFCSFTDLHAMLAFVGARDWRRAKRLVRGLAAAQTLRTRHGETTRRLGLPACRALLAFGRGDDALAVSLLAALPPLARRLGGSHAQRDVLHLTLLRAVDRIRETALATTATGALQNT